MILRWKLDYFIKKGNSSISSILTFLDKRDIVNKHCEKKQDKQW